METLNDEIVKQLYTSLNNLDLKHVFQIFVVKTSTVKKFKLIMYENTDFAVFNKRVGAYSVFSDE